MPDETKPDPTSESPGTQPETGGEAAAGKTPLGPSSSEASAGQAGETAEARHSSETALATADGDEGKTGEEEQLPLEQEVEVQDAGPCRKHVRVTIPLSEIQKRLDQKFTEMMVDAVVPGYRPGKAPRRLIEKRFRKEVADQLKAELLLQSLEQLEDQAKINPISQPDLDPFSVDMPLDGPFVYEFDVEVAPEFELPQYKGLKLKRPVREFTESDIDKALKRFLARFGRFEEKDGPAEVGDYIVTDIIVRDGDEELRRFDDVKVRLDNQLVFRDGTINDFADKIKGVRAGGTREVDLELASNLSNPDLQGKTVRALFRVKRIEQMNLPEVKQEFLESMGFEGDDELREFILQGLKRRLEYEQRRSAREQVLQQISEASQWELPEGLVRRQTEKTLRRKILEMQSAGFSQDEIRSRITLLRQDAFETTVRALKEHFILQKVADEENIQVTEEDIDSKITELAIQNNESPRRVRARLEREDLMDPLVTEILEEKALDLILENAEYEDVPLTPEVPTEAIEEAAVPSASEESEAEESTESTGQES